MFWSTCSFSPNISWNVGRSARERGTDLCTKQFEPIPHTVQKFLWYQNFSSEFWSFLVLFSVNLSELELAAANEFAKCIQFQIEMQKNWHFTLHASVSHPPKVLAILSSNSTPVGNSENSFAEYFNLKALLHYLHFIQVTNPCIILSCWLFQRMALKCTKVHYARADILFSFLLPLCFAWCFMVQYCSEPRDHGTCILNAKGYTCACFAALHCIWTSCYSTLMWAH